MCYAIASSGNAFGHCRVYNNNQHSFTCPIRARHRSLLVMPTIWSIGRSEIFSNNFVWNRALLRR